MIKVFILAGQSNMEGQAVVDLEGRDYNDGKGTLKVLLKDPAHAKQLRHLTHRDGSWRTRDDVFVWYKPENAPVKSGPLGFGFTPYGDKHHFGPELQFGHVLGDALREKVLLVKCAWGARACIATFGHPAPAVWSGRTICACSPIFGRHSPRRKSAVSWRALSGTTAGTMA